MSRPRITYTGAYQPFHRQQDLLNALSLYDPLHIHCPVVVDSISCFSHVVKKNQYPYPVQRMWGDEDNLRKSIMDCLVKAGMLKDDSLVIGGENYKVFSDDDVTMINIYEV